jgi:hypothetical protein
MRHFVSFGAGVGHRAPITGRKNSRTTAAVAAAAAAFIGTSIAGTPAASANSGEAVIVTATGVLQWQHPVPW